MKNLATKTKLSIFLLLSFLNADENTFKNVAEGILLNNKITDVDIIKVQPLKENETVLEIAFKDKLTNSVSFVYAISDKAIIIGKKVENGNIDNSFSNDVLSNYQFTKSSDIFLNTLKQNSISINNFDETKETIYMVSNIDNSDLIAIANSNTFDNYNVKLLLINNNNSSLEKTLNFYSKKLYTKEEFKNFLTSKTSENEKIEFNDFEKLNAIKKVLIEEESLAYNERIGNEILYFYNDTRINLTQLKNKVTKREIK